MTEQQTHDASWYLANWTPEQVAEFAAAQEAEVVALTAGAEPYDDERVAPTPGQWIMLFNQATPERRLQMAAKAIADADHQYECHMLAWPERARDAEAELAQARAQCERWRHTPDRKRAAAEMLRALRAPHPGSSTPEAAERYIASPTCAKCGTQWHPGVDCKGAAESRAQFRRFVDAEVAKILAEAAQPEPKRGSLFAVSSEDVADARLGRYAEQVNTQLRPDTMAALNKALVEYAATDRQRLLNLEAKRISERLTAAGFDVVRTHPADEIAANPPTIGRMIKAFAAPGSVPQSTAPIGALTGWNVQTDLSLPDGYVHLRPGRLMVRREPWWVKGCAVCRQPDGFCDCPEVES